MRGRAFFRAGNAPRRTAGRAELRATARFAELALRTAPIHARTRPSLMRCHITNIVKGCGDATKISAVSSADLADVVLMPFAAVTYSAEPALWCMCERAFKLWISTFLILDHMAFKL